MRESILSLRLFFIIVGIIVAGSGVVLAISSLVVLGSSLASIFLLAQLASNIVFGFGYVYFGLSLRKYLNQDKVKALKKFLLVSYGVGVILTFIEFTADGRIDFLTLVLGALITWYLYRSVGRLSTEFTLAN